MKDNLGDASFRGIRENDVTKIQSASDKPLAIATRTTRDFVFGSDPIDDLPYLLGSREFGNRAIRNRDLSRVGIDNDLRFDEQSCPKLVICIVDKCFECERATKLVECGAVASDFCRSRGSY